MIYLNGTMFTELEALNAYLVTTSLSEFDKQCIRNDFQGVPNDPLLPPKVVTPRQIRLALQATGITVAAIEAFIQSLSEPTKTEANIWFEYSLEFRRDNELMNALAPAMGLTQQDLDNLFTVAETL